MPLSRVKQVGISLSDRTVEICQSGGTTKIARAKLKSGIVKNGKIVKATELKKIIRQLMKTAQPKAITASRVVFSIPENYVFYHTFSLVGVKNKKTEEKMIWEQAKTHIPLPEANLIFKYRRLRQRKNIKDYLLVATDKLFLAEWEKFFKALGLTVIFDLSAQAVFRALKPSTSMVVDLGQNMTKFHLFYDNKLFYSQATFMGGEYLTNCLNNALSISPKQAETLKVDKGLGADDDKVREILTRELHVVWDEVAHAIDQAQDEFNFKIKNVILIGGGAHMKGILKFLRKEKRFGRAQLAAVKGKNRKMDLVYIEALGLSLYGSTGKKGNDFIF